jgi:hypothetical protein
MGSAGTRLSHDDPGILERLALPLSPGSQVRPAGRTTAAHEALCTDAFDLILLYCRLPNLHHQGAPVLQTFERFYPYGMVIFIQRMCRRSQPPAPSPPHWASHEGASVAEGAFSVREGIRVEILSDGYPRNSQSPTLFLQLFGGRMTRAWPIGGLGGGGAFSEA